MCTQWRCCWSRHIVVVVQGGEEGAEHRGEAGHPAAADHEEQGD